MVDIYSNFTTSHLKIVNDNYLTCFLDHFSKDTNKNKTTRRQLPVKCLILVSEF